MCRNSCVHRYVCVQACVCRCVRRCVEVCVHVEACTSFSVHWHLSQWFFHLIFFWYRVSHWTWNSQFSQTCWPISLVSPCLPRHWSHVEPSHPAFTWCWGSEFRSLLLCSEHFTNSVISPIFFLSRSYCVALAGLSSLCTPDWPLIYHRLACSTH